MGLAGDGREGDLTRSRGTFLAIRAAGRCTVAALSERTGQSRPTVVAQLRSLEAAGLVREVPDHFDHSGGRPAALHELVRGRRLVLGLDMLDQSIALAVAELDGTIIHCGQARLSRHGDPMERLRAVVEIIRRSLAGAGLSLADVVVAGVSHTGTIDRAGVLTRATLLRQSVGMHLKRDLERALACPVVLTNDLKAAAHAEYVARLDGDRRVRTLAHCDVDPGVNVAFVVDGQPHRGATGSAGEICELAEVNLPSSTDEWLARVIRAVAWPAALLDPDVFVVNAPPELYGLVVDGVRELLRRSQLEANLNMFEPSRLGLAGSLCGALELGLAVALRRELGPAPLPPLSVRSVSVVGEMLLASHHGITVPRRFVSMNQGPITRLAVLGGSDDLHLPLVAEELDASVRITGVLDATPAASERVLSQMRHEVVVSAAAADLETAGIDVALLVDDRHTSVAVDLLSRGFTVVAPERLATSVPSADALVAAARDGGGRLVVGHQLRWSSLVRTVLDVVSGDELGSPQAILVRHVRPQRLREGKPLFAPGVVDAALLVAGDHDVTASQAVGSAPAPGQSGLAVAALHLSNGVAVTIESVFADAGEALHLTVLAAGGRLEGVMQEHGSSVRVLGRQGDRVLPLPESSVDGLQAEADMVAALLAAARSPEVMATHLEAELALVRVLGQINE